MRNRLYTFGVLNFAGFQMACSECIAFKLFLFDMINVIPDPTITERSCFPKYVSF